MNFNSFRRSTHINHSELYELYRIKLSKADAIGERLDKRYRPDFFFFIKSYKLILFNTKSIILVSAFSNKRQKCRDFCYCLRAGFNLATRIDAF